MLTLELGQKQQEEDEPHDEPTLQPSLRTTREASNTRPPNCCRALPAVIAPAAVTMNAAAMPLLLPSVLRLPQPRLLLLRWPLQLIVCAAADLPTSLRAHAGANMRAHTCVC